MDSRGERNGLVSPPSGGKLASCKQVRRSLEPTAVLIYLICGAFYASMLTFITVAALYFELVWHIPKSLATPLCAVPYTVSALLSPLCGLFADFVGRPLLLVILSCATLTATHFFMGVGLLPPVATMVFLGATFSTFASAIWPMVALVVPQEVLGTAYGTMSAMQNTFLAITPLAVGALGSWLSHGDEVLEQVINQRALTALSAFSLAMALTLAALDLRRGGKMLGNPVGPVFLRAWRRSRRVGGRAELLEAAKSPTGSPMSTPLPPCMEDTSTCPMKTPLLEGARRPSTHIVLTADF